jgi:hypothetical protein
LRAHYLPDYRVETDGKGDRELVLDEGTTSLTVPVGQVALVLVDTWALPGEPQNPGPIRSNQQRLLVACREAGVTVIHAPSPPVVDRYPQYHRLQQSVRQFMAAYDLRPRRQPPFFNWPPDNNPNWRETQSARQAGRAEQSDFLPPENREISPLLTPLPTEYVLHSHIEFRYVLWMERITTLLYAGGALNECLQHRDVGINALAGSDADRVPFTLIVAEDCCSAMAGVEFDADAAARATLEYLKFKLAFTTTIDEIEF